MAETNTLTEPPNRLSWLLCVFFAFGTCGLVPLLLIRWQDNTATPLNVALACTLVAYCGLRLTVILYRGTRDMLDAFFFIYFYVLVAVPGLAQIVANHYPVDNKVYPDGVITGGLLHIYLAIASYEVGRRVAQRIVAHMRRSDEPDDATPVAPVDRHPRAFSPTRSLALAVFAIFMMLFEVASHGVKLFFSSRTEVTAALVGVAPGSNASAVYNSTNKTHGGLLIIASQYTIFIALLVILYCRHHKLWPKPGKRSALPWRVLIVILVAGNVLLNNPKGSARDWFSLVAVGFVAIYLPFKKPGASRIIVAGSVLVLMFAFTTFDAFRNPGGAHVVSKGPRNDLLNNETFGSFQGVLTGEQYVQEYGHTDGRQLAGSAFVFVPRSIWHAKAKPTGQLVDPHYLRSAPAITEAELDFGAAGIAVFFLLYAFMSVLLTERASRAGPGALVCLYPVIAAFQIFFLRGSLQPAFAQLYALLAVAGLVWLPPRRRRVQPEPGLYPRVPLLEPTTVRR